MIDSTGSKEWSFPNGNGFETSPALVDLDNDGTLVIIVGSKDTNLYCFNHTGSVEWNNTTSNSIYSSPCVEDLDGDGIVEILFGCDDNNLHCLSLINVLSSVSQR